MKKILTAVCIVFLAAFVSEAQETGIQRDQDLDKMGILSFGTKVLFLDYNFWNSYTAPGCPALPQTPVFVHGAQALFPITPWFRTGVEAFGISHGIYDQDNITEFAGAYGGIVTDFRLKILDFLHLDGGINLACGRFWFNSMTKAGAGLRASSGAIYLEPHAGFTCLLFRTIELYAGASTMFPVVLEDRVWQGPGTPVNVRPSAFTVEISLGMYLPSFN